MSIRGNRNFKGNLPTNAFLYNGRTSRFSSFSSAKFSSSAQGILGRARYLCTPPFCYLGVLFRCNAPAQKRRHNKKFGRPKFQLKRPLKTVLLVMFDGVPQKSTTSWSNLFKKKKAKVVTKPVVILTTFYSTKW